MRGNTRRIRGAGAETNGRTVRRVLREEPYLERRNEDVRHAAAAGADGGGSGGQAGRHGHRDKGAAVEGGARPGRLVQRSGGEVRRIARRLPQAASNQAHRQGRLPVHGEEGKGRQNRRRAGGASKVHIRAAGVSQEHEVGREAREVRAPGPLDIVALRK